MLSRPSLSHTHDDDNQTNDNNNDDDEEAGDYNGGAVTSAHDASETDAGARKPGQRK